MIQLKLAEYALLKTTKVWALLDFPDMCTRTSAKHILIKLVTSSYKQNKQFRRW
jgi:hypothetical protein